MFSYKFTTGHIYFHETRIVYWEKDEYYNELRFFVKRRCSLGNYKDYLKGQVLAEFCKTASWLIKEHNCDFGADVNQYVLKGATA